MNKIWRKWVRIVRFVVSIQTSLILFIMYYLFIIPISTILKIFSKKSLLGYKGTVKEGSYWVSREKVKQNISWARTQ